MNKPLIASLAAAVTLLCGCEKTKPVTTESAPPPDAPSLPTPEPKTSQPAPTNATASTAPSVTAPASQEPAPAVPEAPKKPVVGSTVWASTRISVTSDDGVFGVPAGTQLRIVKVTDTGFIATDEKREFPVTEGQISMAVAAAAGAAQADQAQRSADAAWHRAQLDAVKQQRETAAANAKTAEEEKKIRELRARIDALVREEAQLMANIESANRQYREANTARLLGRVYSRTITPQQQAAWEGRLAVVRVDLQRVRVELSR
jgi:hypothetical protein